MQVIHIVFKYDHGNVNVTPFTKKTYLPWIVLILHVQSLCNNIAIGCGSASIWFSRRRQVWSGMQYKWKQYAVLKGIYLNFVHHIGLHIYLITFMQPKKITQILVYKLGVNPIFRQLNIQTAQYSDHWNSFPESPLFWHPNIPTSQYSDAYKPNIPTHSLFLCLLQAWGLLCVRVIISVRVRVWLGQVWFGIRVKRIGVRVRLRIV